MCRRREYFTKTWASLLLSPLFLQDPKPPPPARRLVVSGFIHKLLIPSPVWVQIGASSKMTVSSLLIYLHLFALIAAQSASGAISAAADVLLPSPF